MKFFSVIALCLFIVHSLRADKYPNPEIVVILSPDKSALLRVTPATNAVGPIAIVSLFDAKSGDYRKMASFSLRNPISPVDCVVTNDGRYVVTFDDHAALGRNDNVVTVYSGTGKYLRSWRLEDIFAPSEIKTFRVSTQSIWWREGTISVGDGIQPMIAIPMPAEPLWSGRTSGFPIYLDLGTMKFLK